ncbi:MAG: hypothetical protein Q8Q14_01410 [Gemmatimonadales bacterium]|nr:hypothetical protein [Gemmatimonadales bacterium]
MLTQAVATVPDTVRVVDTIRVVDTVWVVQSGRGLVGTVAEWATIIVGVAAVVALFLPILERFRERASVDTAVSVDAYAVRRVVRVWVSSLEGVARGGGLPSLQGLYLGEATDEVEERLQRAVTSAPHASPRVARSIREAYGLYYRVMTASHVETDVAKRTPADQANAAAELADLRACVARLTEAIDPALRDK